MRRGRLVGLWFLASCGHDTRPAVPSALTAGPEAPPASSAAPTPPAPEPHACRKDEDCLLSCHYGAVRKDWYLRPGRKEPCEDGCSSMGMTAKCDAGQCVAYGREGKRADDCTNRPTPP